MEFQSGKLLIATPELADPNFYRTVSLIFHHDQDGAAGLILNRPSNTTIGDVWEELEEDVLVNQAINVGGPVEGPLMAVHTSRELGERPILSRVYLSITRGNLNQLVEQPQHKIKIFSGYAGWGKGQLEAEMKAGGWLTFPAQLNDVFDTPEEIWKTACRKVGNEIMFSDGKVDVEAVDPLAN